MVQRKCAAAVIEDGKGRLLFIRQNYGFKFYGFPGGIVEDGEAAADAAIRETAEEVGLEVEIDYRIGSYLLVGGGWPDILAAVYKVRLVSGVPKIHAKDEISAIKWCEPHAPPRPLLPDAEAALSDFIQGKREVERTYQRKGQMPKWKAAE